MNKMNKFGSYSRFLTWFMAFLLVALVAGCGGGGGGGRDPILGSPTLGVGLISVAVTPAAASIPISAPQRFVATATYTDGSTRDVTASSSWTSGTPGVATVGLNTGLALGVANGTSVITATFGGQTAPATLTVTTATLQSLALTPAAPSIPISAPQQFVATATYTDGSTRDVTASANWTSATPGVATVLQTGVATGVASGTSVITATFLGQIAPATLTVTAATLSSIAVTPAAATVPSGGTQPFVATGTFSDGTRADISNTVTWTSGNTAVATVLPTGVASGLSGGTATITATSGTKAGSATVTVPAATLVSIAVTPATGSVPGGGTQPFVATGTFSDGTRADISNTVTWTSGNTAVATVLPTGVASGLSVGAATITATSGTKAGSATVTVTAATLVSIAVTPATASVQNGGTQPFVATGTFSDGTRADISNTVTWTSGNTAVATVLPTGVASGLSGGTATITATSGTKAGSATVAVAAGPPPVRLGTAGNFVILAKSGISTVPTSTVTGDIGVSPIDRTAITGFSETMDASNTFSTSSQVTGKIYAADYAPPTPANLTTAVSSMEAAYTDAAGRTAGAGSFSNVGNGTVAGQTLVPGVYTWASNVTITTDLTLSGGANDVWIFQIPGTLDLEAGMRVLLVGGAQAKNIFWQVADVVTLKASSHFEGIILAQTKIAMVTGASTNGRLLAQTAVTLQQNTVTPPAP